MISSVTLTSVGSCRKTKNKKNAKRLLVLTMLMLMLTILLLIQYRFFAPGANFNRRAAFNRGFLGGSPPYVAVSVTN